MTAKDPSFAPPGISSAALQTERACFDGTLLAALAYGALLMLYTQLVPVLLTRPKRGRTFWAIVLYTVAMFPLATLSIAGLLKFSEMTYIDNRNYPGGPAAFHQAYFSDVINVMGLVSETILPWIGDILMLFRLMVFWNYNWCISIFPVLVYLAKTAVSIPMLVSFTKPNDPAWVSKAPAYATSYYSLTVAFNIFTSVAICMRFCMMRRKIETVMGQLRVAFYTSTATMFIESGSFFTIWATLHLVLRSRKSVSQEIFLLTYIHILSITRLLVVLRVAQDRAWSKDLVTATDRGVLDWQVSSTHSVPLHDMPPSSISFNNKILPRKFQDTEASL